MLKLRQTKPLSAKNMEPVPSKISANNFQKMLSGDKSYLPNKIKKELRNIKLAGNRQVSKERALRAVKHLRNKGLISKYKPASVLYREAAIKQKNDDEMAEEAERQKHVQVRLKMDLAEEMEAIETGKNPYDPRTALGKSVAEEIEAEKQKREKKITTERLRRSGIYGKNPNKQQRPELADTDKLLDLDIG